MGAQSPSAGEAVPPLLEPLLGVHSAPSPSWLADAATTAAERGLGALYGLLYLLDEGGGLCGERPASSERMRALARLNQALGADLTALRFGPQALPEVMTALREGRARALPELGQALPLLLDGDELRAVQRHLGVDQVWLAPLHWNGESLGLLLLLMPAGPPSSLALAELLGCHLAVALKNLRQRETARRLGEIDAVRWVSDERRFADQLANEILRAERHQRPLSVLLLRVQNSQELRTRYGRFLADRVLRRLAFALDDALRQSDFLGAFQEDGLAVILVEADQGAAERVRERLAAALAQVALPQADLPGLHLQLAYATATFPEDGQTVEELTGAARARLGYETSQQERAASAG